jgi:beta-phosphoglucomutase-like phosphatase (HAD superfamily)
MDRTGLVIFDLYNLIESHSLDPFPGTADILDQLIQHDLKLAVVSHQAGVLWRAWKEDPRYPDAHQVAHRLQAVSEALPQLRTALWLVAIYDERVRIPRESMRALAAAVTRAAQPLWVYSSARPEWRKPQPQMLVQACRMRKTSPANAIFVGRSEADEDTAQRAGVKHMPVFDLRAQGGVDRLLALIGARRSRRQLEQPGA